MKKKRKQKNYRNIKIDQPWDGMAMNIPFVHFEKIFKVGGNASDDQTRC
jgi:hypothetical protein